MQKMEIARRIQREAGLSKEQTVRVLDWILDLFKTTLQKGESINIVNFGVFTIRSKAARKGRNPITGEEVMISARRVVTFRASINLKDEVNAVPT